jgi:hypothetical protein
LETLLESGLFPEKQGWGLGAGERIATAIEAKVAWPF